MKKTDTNVIALDRRGERFVLLYDDSEASHGAAAAALLNWFWDDELDFDDEDVLTMHSRMGLLREAVTMTEKIERWIVPICGFTQRLGRPNGIGSLWRKLRPCVSPETSLIFPQRWNADFEDLADWIEEQSVDNPRIDVFAYSWGCGHGFLQFAKELSKRGKSIQTAVLSDPVYHSWYRPWRAVFFPGEIVIPSNVREVFCYRQEMNRPSGAELVWNKKTTAVHTVQTLHRIHQYMDDAPEFHAKCLEVVA